MGLEQALVEFFKENKPVKDMGKRAGFVIGMDRKGCRVACDHLPTMVRTIRARSWDEATDLYIARMAPIIPGLSDHPERFVIGLRVEQ